MTVWNVESFSDEDINAIVERLRAQGSDDNDCEAKAAVGKLNKDVWNTVSAFANTDGGVILLGIDETSGFIPAQGFDPNKIIDSVDNGLGDKAPRVEPVPTFQVRRFTFEGANRGVGNRVDV
ncbi:ATP-binding protein [Corynebacterium sp. MSK218]|uniref:AlbA family DNA-binding domain-containing protein n=1 Tax=Corynebacterium sp. MSK218 TaxID=3050218 RepID=UPI00254D74C6|nr:ATP-binding protein [Corynebacterium sp. MSK218]MDK8764188.1 ATP-binding protein [Corynebacterium sp. MSK218]